MKQTKTDITIITENDIYNESAEARKEVQSLCREVMTKRGNHRSADMTRMRAGELLLKTYIDTSFKDTTIQMLMIFNQYLLSQNQKLAGEVSQLQSAFIQKLMEANNMEHLKWLMEKETPKKINKKI